MQIINQLPGEDKAFEIQADIDALINYASAALERIYRAVNTKGQEQQILDHFGNEAAKALHGYQAFYTAMEAVAPGRTPVADPTVFVAQDDGTVLFVRPPEPPVFAPDQSSPSV